MLLAIRARGARGLWRALTRITRRRPHRRPSHVSRGQALVEFCFVVPVLFLMVAGSTSVTTLLDDHLNILYAVRSAARVGSTLGTSPGADCAIIGALDAALANDHDINIQQITIFKAQSDGTPYPGLKLKDIYPGNATCGAGDVITPNATSATWPPNGNPGGYPPRSNTPFLEDTLGVQVQYSYNITYNFLNVKPFSITDQAVMPIEIVVTT